MLSCALNQYELKLQKFEHLIYVHDKTFIVLRSNVDKSVLLHFKFIVSF